MKKVLNVCICGMMAAMLVAGCAKKETATDATTTEATTAESSGTGSATIGGDTDSVTLGNYKGVTYTPLSTEVTDEDVEARIQSLMAQRATTKEVDRAAKDGDTVNIDYVGMKDGVAFEGGTAAGYNLVLGSGNFIDGFEDGLIGATKGQELSLDLTFPENYPSADLAGQAVVFDVTVNSVAELVEAELNDAFVNENTEYATVEEYRTAIKAGMEEEARANAENKKKSDVLLKVIDDSEIMVSDATLDEYYNRQVEVYEKQAEAAGLDLATMAGYYGMTEEVFKEQLKLMSQEVTKQNAVVNAIAEAEGITVADEERDALAVDFGYESVEAMLEEAGQKTVDEYILTDKVVTFIAEQAVEA